MFSKLARRPGALTILGALLVGLLALAGWQMRGPSAVLGGAGLAAPSGGSTGGSVEATGPHLSAPTANGIMIGSSVRNDVSPALRDIPPVAWDPGQRKAEHENPPIRIPGFKDAPDPVVQRSAGAGPSAAMPAPLQTFEGIDYPGVACNCAPPDTDGEVGPTQYVQMVNEGLQVFNKSGASLYGPVSITTLWSGFGGVCETGGAGDPVLLYDQLADRWVATEFAGGSTITDECIAVSTSGDAAGSYYRYDFHLGSNFFDYPHLGVWPDGYYMSMNVFNSAGTSFLGPEPFVFDRSAMLAGQPASFQTKAALGSTVGPFLPADLDGATAPPAGAPNFFVGFGNPMPLYKFHVDWTTPANTTFTNNANLAVAGFTQLCSTSRSCIAQPGTSSKLDGIGDRPMFRLAYRNFGDHEAMVVNQSVNVGSGQAGVRWYEIRNPNTSPTIYQQGTFAPDATSRWMGSAAMDGSGDLAVGYSASSSSVYPSLRYAGRLAGDPLGQLAQGEAVLYAGAGSQASTSNRWGDYSDLTVDPTDDCTFWYTSEYYPSGATQYNWRTRIGSFRFPGCGGPQPTATPTAIPTNTPTNTPVVPTNTPTNTPTPNPNPPDFTVSVSPASQSVARGGSTSFTVTLTSVNGFAGNVSLSVTGLPSRTSATFSPNPVALTAGGGGTATLTIKTNRNAALGTYTLTVQGTSGSTAHSQNVTLTITR